jgi:cell division protein FtsN
MRWLSSRYTHVPLAAASVVLLLAAIGALLLVRFGGTWPPWRSLTAPAPSVVAIPAASESGLPAAGEPAAGAAAPRGEAPRPARPPREAAPFALEAGPFSSGEAADRVEAELNRLGHSTVRFLRQDTTRLFVVTATGFASPEEARAAVRAVGRGTVLEEDGVVQVSLGRHPSLAEAVAAARPLRARGFEVRVTEALAPVVRYHVRYGQFARRTDAEAYREALARRGIQSRVVKVR